MKKKLLSLLVAFSMVLPLGLALTACGDKHECEAATTWSSDDTHHWHACTDEDCEEVLDKTEHTFTTETVDATIDADGKITKTCSVCSKVVETTIPKLVQTKSEMIAVMEQAAKTENYTGDIQSTYSRISNTQNFQIALPENEEYTTYTLQKEDGTTLRYRYENERVDYVHYIIKDGNNNLEKSLYYDGTTPHASLYYVGNNYAKNLLESDVVGYLEFIQKVSSEESLKAMLSTQLKGFIDQFVGGTIEAYDENDFTYALEAKYENKVYSAKGYIMLADEHVTGKDGYPVKHTDFRIDYDIEYTKDMITKNNSKISTQLLTIANGSKTEFFIENNNSYTKTINESHISTVEDAIAEHLDPDATPSNKTETLNFVVNGDDENDDNRTGVDFTTESINSLIDAKIAEIEAVAGGAEINVYLDEAKTIEYDSSVPVKMLDYYTTYIYIDYQVSA